MSRADQRTRPELGHLRSSFICLTGVDGAGKTTQAHRLVELLRSRTMKARYVYLRMPHLVSKPLMALCRLTGITETIKTDDGTSVRGFHHYYRSKVLTSLVPWLQALDMHLYTWAKVRLHQLMGTTVVCDRYVLDTMIDMIAETRRPNLHQDPVGDFFMATYPPNTKQVILTGSIEGIRERKDDLKWDRWFEEKYSAFQRAVHVLDRFSPETIDTTQRDIDEAFDDIVHWLSSEAGKEPRKWIKAIRYLVTQGMVYADHTDRAMRVATLAALALLLAPPSLLLPGGPLAVLPASHLANFALSASFWATLSCDLKLAPPVGKKKMYAYLNGLRTRLGQCESMAACCAFGSIARRGFNDTSDLDMVAIRKPGPRHALTAARFVLRERLIALGHRIPLELWLADSPGFLSKLRSDEVAVALKNDQSILETHFESTQSLEEAMESNGDVHLVAGLSGTSP